MDKKPAAEENGCVYGLVRFLGTDLQTRLSKPYKTDVIAYLAPVLQYLRAL